MKTAFRPVKVAAASLIGTAVVLVVAQAADVLDRDQDAPRGPGCCGGGRGPANVEPGTIILPVDVKAYSKESPGDPAVLRASFLELVAEDAEEQGFRGPRLLLSPKSFFEKRRAYLLEHPEVKNAVIPET